MAVVAGEPSVETALGPCVEAGVELFEETVQDEAGEDGGEGVALGEAFVLEEVGRGAVGGAEEALVCLAVHEVEVGQEGAELGVGGKDIAGAVAGGFVERVDDVKKEESALGVLLLLDGLGDTMVELDLVGVD